MGHFDRIRIMLDEMMTKLPAASDKAVTNRLVTLASDYLTITKPHAAKIDYSHPITHAAYVLCYMSSNAELITKALAFDYDALGKVFSKSNVRIACFGGGPGTELLAIFKILDFMPKMRPKLVFDIFDREKAWESVWPHVLSTKSKGVNAEINFCHMEYEEGSAWNLGDEDYTADIYIFSFSLCEAWRYNGTKVMTKFLANLISHAKPGAIFVYSDNAGEFEAQFKEHFLDHADLDLLGTKTYDSKGVMPSDEQLESLDEYVKRFGRMPKMKATATCAALVKLR